MLKDCFICQRSDLHNIWNRFNIHTYILYILIQIFVHLINQSMSNMGGNLVVIAVADPGGARGHGPLGPVKICHKKMAAEGGRIDFMFLGPFPPAAESATLLRAIQ